MHSDTNNHFFSGLKAYFAQSWQISQTSSKAYKIVTLAIFIATLTVNLSIMQSFQHTSEIERRAFMLSALLDPIIFLLMCHYLIRPFLQIKMLGSGLSIRVAIGWVVFLIECGVFYYAIHVLMTEIGPLKGADVKHLQIVTEDGSVDAVMSEATMWVVGSFSSAVNFAVWSVAYMLWHQLQARKQLQQQVQKAQMQQLTNQLSPHFLFNTFNSIRALIYEDQDKAAETVTELSELFRIHMQAHLRTQSSLEEEWQVAKRYLDIEQIRLEERLVFTIDVDESLWQADLPTLTLLTFVENAIKHGISPSASIGFINIKAKVIDDDHWQLHVSNSYKPGMNIGGTRVGLKNVAKRLKLTYQKRFKFEKTAKNNIFTVEVTLPLRHKESDHD